MLHKSINFRSLYEHRKCLTRRTEVDQGRNWTFESNPWTQRGRHRQETTTEQDRLRREDQGTVVTRLLETPSVSRIHTSTLIRLPPQYSERLLYK